MSKNILFYSDSLGDILAGEFVTGVLSDDPALPPFFPRPGDVSTLLVF